jgi:hypothetical protein
MPNPYTVPVLPRWTRDKEAWTVLGHAEQIQPGACVTVTRQDSSISLVTIGHTMTVAPDESGTPMAIGWPMR